MELNDLVALYFERSNAMQTLWGFYITIVMGILAFLGSVTLRQPKWLIVAPLAAAFVGFVLVNLNALRSITRQRHTVVDLIRAGQFKNKEEGDSPTTNKILADLDPPKAWQVTAFHLLGDALALFGFLGLAYRA
jgi:hypothetical protein